MARYLIARFISLVFVLFIVSMIAFLLMHAVPVARSTSKNGAYPKRPGWPSTQVRPG